MSRSFTSNMNATRLPRCVGRAAFLTCGTVAQTIAGMISPNDVKPFDNDAISWIATQEGMPRFLLNS